MTMVLISLAIWLIPALLFTIYFFTTDPEFRERKTVLNGCHWSLITGIAISWPLIATLYTISVVTDERDK